MVKENELRIGNALYFKSDISGEEKVLIVDWVFFSEDFCIRNSRPIPLTQEWINRMGFKYVKQTNGGI